MALERLVRYARDVGLGVGEPFSRERMKNTSDTRQRKDGLPSVAELVLKGCCRYEDTPVIS